MLPVFSCHGCRLSGWSALKNRMKLSLYLVDGIIKFIIWYLTFSFMFQLIIDDMDI
jgi:hypothetical protein